MFPRKGQSTRPDNQAEVPPSVLDDGDPLSSGVLALARSVEGVIQGKAETIEMALVCLLAEGHLLIEDVPGVGKTTLAQALARSFDCSFHRIQFTSDLLPSDLTGVSIYNQARQEFEFRPGPLFANIVLADEINRTTPKTQSALLEAMSEGRITVEDRTYSLDLPFMVIATQNPLEHHGTYPLPESQLDRFLMRIQMGYPSREDEKRILRSHICHTSAEELTPVVTVSEILAAQRAVQQVQVAEPLLDYLMSLVVATRDSEQLELGISPRGSMALYRAAQARAFVRGRSYCVPDDVKQLAVAIFSHRVVVAPQFHSPRDDGDQAEQIIRALVEEVEVPL